MGEQNAAYLEKINRAAAAIALSWLLLFVLYLI